METSHGGKGSCAWWAGPAHCGRSQEQSPVLGFQRSLEAGEEMGGLQQGSEINCQLEIVLLGGAKVGASNETL